MDINFFLAKSMFLIILSVLGTDNEMIMISIYSCVLSGSPNTFMFVNFKWGELKKFLSVFGWEQTTFIITQRCQLQSCSVRLTHSSSFAPFCLKCSVLSFCLRQFVYEVGCAEKCFICISKTRF